MQPVAYNKDKHILLRGYPRDRHLVEEAQKMMQASLVGDFEHKLIAALDTAWDNIRVKINREAKQRGVKPQYPDFIQMPGETDLFVPIPYEVKIEGWNLPLRLVAWHKPAWFRVSRIFAIGAKKIGDTNARTTTTPKKSIH